MGSAPVSGASIGVPPIGSLRPTRGVCGRLIVLATYRQMFTKPAIIAGVYILSAFQTAETFPPGSIKKAP
jgi:hypothetical protein